MTLMLLAAARAGGSWRSLAPLLARVGGRDTRAGGVAMGADAETGRSTGLGRVGRRRFLQGAAAAAGAVAWARPVGLRRRAGRPGGAVPAGSRRGTVEHLRRIRSCSARLRRRLRDVKACHNSCFRARPGFLLGFEGGSGQAWLRGAVAGCCRRRAQPALKPPELNVLVAPLQRSAAVLQRHHSSKSRPE